MKNIANNAIITITMDSVISILFYVFSFLAIYIQVFFLVTYIEKRKTIIKNPDKLKLKFYPTVTVAVPCYNEEGTITKTVNSLLNLDYPKSKLRLFLIDDGSKDNTWNIIKEFHNGKNIFAFTKENGGKHTALNLALERTDSEFFGCLDSDSLVHPQALKRILSYFERDKETMAVCPSIVVYEPKNFLQKAQTIEYHMSIYNKKMLGFVGGIHVTPGPFSIFRKKVFDELGPYHKAHNTEDQEIALRMQKNGYKIDHCPDAYVYTITPNTVRKLYKQRLRWIYGFIKNLMDYKTLLFKKKYGTVGLLTLPSGIIGVLGVIFLFVNVIYNLSNFIYHKIIQIQTVGFENLFSFNGFNFDWFFFNTKAVIFSSIFMYGLILTSLLIGRKLAENRAKFSMSVFYYLIVYSVIAPFWMLKAALNSIVSKESSWTGERKVKSS